MCYDGDPAEVWSQALTKARKPYRCCECSAAIPPGTKYMRINIMQERGIGWEVFKMHWECYVLWGCVQEHLCGGEGGIALGGLSEEFGNYGVGEGDTVESLTEEWDGELPSDVADALPYLQRFEAIRAKYGGVVSREARP